MSVNKVGGPGSYNVICDVCGLKYKASDVSRRWDGMMVCKSDLEPRHPQEFVRAVPDVSKLPFVRPDSDGIDVSPDLNCGDDPTFYLELPGVAGNYASTPDSAANSVTGDLDLRVKVALDDWTPATLDALISKWDDTAANQRSYILYMRVTGFMELDFSSDGTAATGVQSTAAVPATDGAVIWVRVTLDGDDGGGNKVVKFYTSTDGVSWTQLGATNTSAGTTTIFDGTAALEVGAYNPGGTSLVAKGKFYRAQVYNGIGGTLVVDFDTGVTTGRSQTTLIATTGEVWTINQSGNNVAHIVQVDAPNTGGFVVDTHVFHQFNRILQPLADTDNLQEYTINKVRTYGGTVHIPEGLLVHVNCTLEIGD